MSESKNGWGGVRKGAGRKKVLAPDGTEQKMCSLRAGASEWETIKAFAKILKKDPERAARMMATE